MLILLYCDTMPKIQRPQNLGITEISEKSPLLGTSIPLLTPVSCDSD